MPDNVLDPPNDLAGIASALLQAGFHAEADALGGRVVVRLQGELDMATAPVLSRALDTALDARPNLLALDLRELTFVDSTGIRVLITACRRAGGQGTLFVLRDPCRPVLKALRLTGVDRLMVVEPGPSST
jgi:anti-sigma B factor antagonist